MLKIKFRDWFIYLLSALGILIHLLVSLSQPLAFDEIASLFFSQTFTLWELIISGPEIIHPPLYYILIKLIYQITPGVFVLRLFQFCIFISSLIVIYKICRLLTFSRKMVRLTLLIFIFSPYFLRLTYWLRMYGLGMLLILISIYYSIKYLDHPNFKNHLLLMISIFCGFFVVYGTIFAVFGLLIASIVLYLKNKKTDLILFSLVLSIAYFTVWLISRIFLFKNELQFHLNWVVHPSLYNLGKMLQYLFGFNEDSDQLFPLISITNNINNILFSIFSIIILLLISAFLIYLIIKSAKEKKYIFFYSLILGLIVALFSTFIISVIFPISLFHARQLFPAAIGFHFLLVVFIIKIESRFAHLGKLIKFIVLIVFVFLCTTDLPPRIIYYDQGYFLKPDTISLPKYMIYPDIVLAYHVCHATSFDNIKSSCGSRGITVVKNISEIPKLNTASAILVSDANKAIFGDNFFQPCSKLNQNNPNIFICN